MIAGTRNLSNLVRSLGHSNIVTAVGLELIKPNVVEAESPLPIYKEWIKRRRSMALFVISHRAANDESIIGIDVLQRKPIDVGIHFRFATPAQLGHFFRAAREGAAIENKNKRGQRWLYPS